MLTDDASYGVARVVWQRQQCWEHRAERMRRKCGRTEIVQFWREFLKLLTVRTFSNVVHLACSSWWELSHFLWKKSQFSSTSMKKRYSPFIRSAVAVPSSATMTPNRRRNENLETSAFLTVINVSWVSLLSATDSCCCAHPRLLFTTGAGYFEFFDTYPKCFESKETLSNCWKRVSVSHPTNILALAILPQDHRQLLSWICDESVWNWELHDPTHHKSHYIAVHDEIVKEGYKVAFFTFPTIINSPILYSTDSERSPKQWM